MTERPRVEGKFWKGAMVGAPIAAAIWLLAIWYFLS